MHVTGSYKYWATRMQCLYMRLYRAIHTNRSVGSWLQSWTGAQHARKHSAGFTNSQNVSFFPTISKPSPPGQSLGTAKSSLCWLLRRAGLLGDMWWEFGLHGLQVFSGGMSSAVTLSTSTSPIYLTKQIESSLVAASTPGTVQNHLVWQMAVPCRCCNSEWGHWIQHRADVHPHGIWACACPCPGEQGAHDVFFPYPDYHLGHQRNRGKVLHRK